MKEVLLISKPGRFLIVALAVALASAIFITPFLNRLPWLIGVPILIGTVLVILGEFWEPISFFMHKSASHAPAQKDGLHPVRAPSGS